MRVPSAVTRRAASRSCLPHPIGSDLRDVSDFGGSFRKCENLPRPLRRKALRDAMPMEWLLSMGWGILPCDFSLSLLHLQACVLCTKPRTVPAVYGEMYSDNMYSISISIDRLVRVMGRGAESGSDLFVQYQS
jgi:hypothetical protein